MALDDAARISRLTAAGLFVICMGLYTRVLSADLVYDSRAQILTDTYIHDRAHVADVLSLAVMSQDVMDNNRPLHLLSMMIDAALWRQNPFGYHLTSVLLHACCAVLLFFVLIALLRRTDHAPQPALFAAAIGAAAFAVHPLNCEAVADPSYREDLLTTSCVLAAILFADAFRAVATPRSWLLAAGCAFASFLAVTAKESGAAGPVILLVYWLCFRRGESRAGWGALLAASTLLAAGFLVARFTLPPKISEIFPPQPPYLGGSFTHMLQIQPRIWAFHLKHLFWYGDLCADYGAYSIRGITLGAALLALGAAIAVLAWLASRNRLVSLGAVVYVAAMLPVSNLVPMYQPMGDRYSYLPSLGVAMIASAVLATKWRGVHEGAGRWLGVACAALLVVLASATYRREAVWQDSLVFWRTTLETNVRSVNGASGLGWAHYDAGQAEAARDSFLQSLELSRGTCADCWVGMAMALDALGQPERADAAFSRCLTIDPAYADPARMQRRLRLEPEQAKKLWPIARRHRPIFL